MAQKEYLKMADVFVGSVIVRFSTELRDGCGFICDAEDEEQAKYILHAINSHDELVGEVDRLREMLSECYPFIKDKADWGTEYEIDLADRVFYSAGVLVDE